MTEQIYIFRAAAADTSEIIVQCARKLPGARPFIRNMRVVQLDSYLWQMEKPGQTR